MSRKAPAKQIEVSTTGRYVRLSDPAIKAQVLQINDRGQKDPQFALKLLIEAGIATKGGKLSKASGG